MPTDFYDVLGVPADASSEELKRAYRSRVREYHPDVNDHPQGDAQFKLIRKANDVLTDPAERKDYDRMGHREYAEKRLDDLPPFSVFPELEDTSATESDEETRRTGTGTSSTGTTSNAGRTSTSASTTTGRSRKSQRERTSQSSSSASAESGSATGDTSTSSSTGRATDRREETSTSERATAGTETAGSSEWGDLSGDAATRNADESTTPAGVRRRRGLRRWYGVVLVSLFTYVGGVAAYLLANRGDALTLVTGLQTAPVSTLLGAVSMQSPTDFVLAAATTAAAGTPTLGLLLLVGAALLPLVVLTAVAQYGHGSAWMYALASLGPVATLAGYPFVALPVAALLVGLVVLPLISGLGFLIDVGRYLLATR